MGLVVAVLVISFAIWGIGDMFRGFGMSRVAKIGNVEIGVEQFRQIYNERLQQLSRQVGRPITMDQARAFGLDRQILGQLVAESALDERVRQIGLGLSDAQLAERVTSDPAFRGPSGQFDRFRFEQLIRQAGYTEARFLAEQRKVSLRRQVAGAITAGLKPPRTMVEATHRFQNEERAAEYVVLDPNQAGEIPAPGPDVLAKYFDDRKVLFRAPEYRKLVLLSLTPGDLGKWMQVSDEDAKAEFDRNRERYVTPERRQLQQIVFPNAEEARAAADRIGQGTSFLTIASERGLKESDIDLGTVARSSIIDRAVADAAFALKEGEVSAPVQGRFGTALVRAVKVEPEHARAFEEVAEEIKTQIGQERARSQAADLHNKIEDERASGAGLAEVAQRLQLQARTIEAIDRSGRSPEGMPVLGLPVGTDVLTPAFATDMGVENEPLQVDGGHLWYEVAGITPSRERPLEEVKDQVEARWRADEIAARLRTKAAEILDKLKSGATLAEVATADGLKVETETGLKRASRSQALPGKVVEEIFRTPKGAPGSAPGEQPVIYYVFRVTDVTVPELDMASEESKRIVETLKNAYADDLLTQYITRVQSDIGVSINQTALNQVVGGGTTN
jgi:peptidyl-prolyl cis-trans isomerase D